MRLPTPRRRAPSQGSALGKKAQSQGPASRGGEPLSCQGPYKITTLKTSLLYLAKHLLSSPPYCLGKARPKGFMGLTRPVGQTFPSPVPKGKAGEGPPPACLKLCRIGGQEKALGAPAWAPKICQSSRGPRLELN
uniref:Uncharacterized protein n=1 Tax=Pipistrellus kuhlii TaxID=59472 RepID=A0A7J7ZKH9_PIPKU|nr:hypothetical protein mPipKuh1_009665 [Pipistrellus kuhlii]